jgi:serine phosphatase RsbU (regulator of sigma subunit)
VPYGTGSAGRAVQERTTVLVEDVETSPHYGAFRAGALAHGVRSVLSVPMLTLGGEAVGCLSTYYRSPVAPEPRDLELAAVYSAQAAEIVERARVHAEARALAARERRRSEQLHALAGAALSLSAADSLDEVLQLVTEAAVAVIGCHQGVTSRLPDGWANASTYVSLSERYASWRDYDRVPRGLGVLNAVTRENRPLRLTPDQLAAHPEWRGLRDAPDHPPLPDYLAAPLVGRDGRNLGLVQLSHKVDETAFTAEDEAILVQLAQLASGTVERLEALEAERSARAEAEAAAEALQRPVGLTAAARYLPGAAGTRVGGDWYDLLQVGDVVVLVVGDVMGRGVPAAALMGQLRATTRAYALEGHGPAEVLRRLDDVVLSLTGLHFTTCVVAVLDPVARTLRAASAGHLPPVLVTRDGTARLLPLDPCLPLGVGGGAFVETCAELQPGTLVLLYTDGLVESREASLEEGTARLLAAASGPVASAEATCDAVLAALGAAEGDDDTALLAVRMDPAVDGAEPLSLALPSGRCCRARRSTATSLSCSSASW